MKKEEKGGVKLTIHKKKSTSKSPILLGLRDICKWKLALEENDTEQRRLVNQLKGLDKGVKTTEKNLFSTISNHFLVQVIKKINDFKNRMFPKKDKISTQKREPV